MGSFSEDFSILEQNVRGLIQKRKETEAELEKMRGQLNLLTEQLKVKEAEVEELKEKNKILRIASGAKSGDSREIKLKINEMVRELDKCIAQLNQ